MVLGYEQLVECLIAPTVVALVFVYTAHKMSQSIIAPSSQK